MRSGVRMVFHCSPDLREEIAGRATNRLGGMNEVIVELLAKACRRPELATVPHAKRGRKVGQVDRVKRKRKQAG